MNNENIINSNLNLNKFMMKNNQDQQQLLLNQSHLAFNSGQKNNDHSPGFKEKHHLQQFSQISYSAPFTTSPAPSNHHSQHLSAHNMPRKQILQSNAMPEKDCHQGLIDWVNSFNDPYCLLVNSLHDLTDGIALCHLVGVIVCTQGDVEKIKELVYYDATTISEAQLPQQNELALQNLDLAINILKSSNYPIPEPVQKLTAQGLGWDKAFVAMALFLQTLKQINDILNYKDKASQKSQIADYPNTDPNNIISQGQAFIPHYASIQPCIQNQQQNQQTQQMTRDPSQQSALKHQTIPQIVTPRGCQSDDATRNSHSSEYINSNQSGRNCNLYAVNSGIISSNGQLSEPQFLEMVSSQRKETTIQAHPHQQTGSIDVRSWKENLPTNQTMQASQVIPFLVNQNQPQHSNQNWQKAVAGAEIKRFDKSFEINNISPIGNKRKQVSPISTGSGGKQQQKSASLENIIRIPKVNVQVAVQKQQDHMNDMEELQIVHEIHELDLSIKNAQRKQTTSQNQQQVSPMSRVSSENKSIQSKRKKTASQEQKERIRQRQSENNDYSTILKNTQNLIMKSKIIDNMMPDMKHENSNLEAPLSFLVDNKDKQIFSERLGESGSKNRFTQDSRLDDVQRSIRFKIDPQPQTERQKQTNTKGQMGAAVSSSDIPDYDIMSEMQTLKVRPESNDGQSRNGQKQLMFKDIQIIPVETKTKLRILDWLANEVKLVKHNQRLIEDLPLYCKNGVFLCDLAQRLSGRETTIRGIDRNPKNITQILNNFNRVLDYLRSFPRFCPRYLWTHRYLMEGNSDVVWGLLDDMWHWHFNKISPNDPGHEKYLAANQVQSLSPERVNSPVSNYQTVLQKRPDDNQEKKSTHNFKLPPKISTGVRQAESRSSNQIANLNIQKFSNTPIKGSSRTLEQTTLGRGGSYTNLHSQQLQKTPQRTPIKTPQKSALKQPPPPLQNNSSTQNDLPLKQFRKASHHRNGSSRSKRKDISAFSSPIARDINGILYYMNAPIDNQDRSVFSLFSAGGQVTINSHQHIKITPEIVGEVRNWLFTLKFGQYLSKEFDYTDICNDPFCNGLLLAELISLLEKITLLKIIQVPKTIAESRQNVQKVLSVIKQRRKEFPQKLLNEESIENILKRDQQTIYSILHYLKNLYPEAAQEASSNPPNYIFTSFDNCQMTNQNLSLPYSGQEIKLLEISLLNWFKKMGIFSKLYGTLEVNSLIQIQKDISNGILIAQVVQTIFNVKINGLFKDPKTEATALANIRKPLEIIRRQSKMSQKFTWTEKEILEGRMSVVIGLLEDLHRCFDGLPPRKRGLNYFSDGPYLGLTLYDTTNHSDSLKKTENQGLLPYEYLMKQKKEANEAKQDAQKTTLNTLQQQTEVQLEGLLDMNKYQELPSIFRNNQPLSRQSKFLLVNEEASKSVPQIQTHGFDKSKSPQSPLTNNSRSHLTHEGIRQPNFAPFLNLKLQKEHNTANSFSPLRSNSEKRIASDNLLFPPSTTTKSSFNIFAKPAIQLENSQKDSRVAEALQRMISREKSPSQKKHNFVLPQQQQEIINSHKKEVLEQYPVPPTRSPLNLNNRCQQSFEFDLRSNLKKPPCQISVEDYENEEHNLNRLTYNMKEKGKIFEWIQSLNLKLPLGFNLEVEPNTFFKDGLLLGELIGTLEGFKVEGLQLNPKSQASCLQNIRKSLQVLKKKNQVPLYLLYSEEEIYNGNGEIIFQLLKSLRQAYKGKVRSNSKTTSVATKKQSTLGGSTAAGTMNQQLQQPPVNVFQ